MSSKQKSFADHYMQQYRNEEADSCPGKKNLGEPEASKRSGQGDQKTAPPDIGIGFFLFFCLLFYGYFFILSLFVPALIDRMMSPELSLGLSGGIPTEYVLQASRGRFAVHLLAYSVLMLVPMIVAIRRKGYKTGCTAACIVLLFLSLVGLASQGSLLRVRQRDFLVTAEKIEGMEAENWKRRRSMLLNEIDFDKTKNSNIPGLEFVSVDKKRIVLPSFMFHGQDRENILNHVKSLASAAKAKPPLPHDSTSPDDTEPHESKKTRKAPGWAWLCGVFALPMVGLFTMGVASALNKHNRNHGSGSVALLTRNIYVAILLAAYCSLVFQVVVAAVLVFGRLSAGLVFWMMWTLMLLLTILVIRKTRTSVLQSWERLHRLQLVPYGSTSTGF